MKCHKLLWFILNKAEMSTLLFRSRNTNDKLKHKYISYDHQSSFQFLPREKTAMEILSFAKGNSIEIRRYLYLNSGSAYCYWYFNGYQSMWLFGSHWKQANNIQRIFKSSTWPVMLKTFLLCCSMKLHAIAYHKTSYANSRAQPKHNFNAGVYQMHLLPKSSHMTFQY